MTGKSKIRREVINVHRLRDPDECQIAVALFLLAVFIYRGIYSEHSRSFVPAFTITGAVATATGLHMTFTWPMPGS